MKQRTGFVSNSSSTSFSIFGAYLDGEQLKNISEDGYELNEETAKILKENGFEQVYLQTGEGSGYAYLGRSLDGLGLDETRRQFEANVNGALTLLFPENTPKASNHEESWYNG